MPSGGITITPGYQLAPGEKVNNTKLNQLGQPVGQVDEGAITERELNISAVQAAIGLPGRNLLCNGDFTYWPKIDDTGFGATPVTGVVTHPITGTVFKHEYSGPARWVIPNDSHRGVQRGDFPPGEAPVPDSPIYYVFWNQTAAIAGISPAYFGQRIERVDSMSGRTFTFTIWVRSIGSATAVIPSVRQCFGDPAFSPSADVVQTGDSVPLPADIWTKVKATFELASVAGKTIAESSGSPGNPGSFTEFRIEVPQGRGFQYSIAHAQLIEGTLELTYDNRLRSIDITEAQRYRQLIGIMLSDNIITHGSPSVNLPVKPRVGLGVAHLKLTPGSGTGGTVAVDAFAMTHIFQDANHSAISSARILVDCEIYKD